MRAELTVALLHRLPEMQSVYGVGVLDIATTRPLGGNSTLGGVSPARLGYNVMTTSKVVLPTVKLGPPNWTKSRTFVLRFTLALQ